MFGDRTEAGRRLAHQLNQFRDHAPIVLAVPPGGVPVAFEIAAALDAVLDVVLVERIAAAGRAIGAVVDRLPPEAVVRQDLVDGLGLSEREVSRESAEAAAALERRRRALVGDQPPPELADETVILVDDGAADGESLQTVLRALRRARPKHLVLALPVAPPERIRMLQPLVDAVVCLATPSDFGAAARHYDDYRPLGDGEVAALLERAGTAGPPAGLSAGR